MLQFKASILRLFLPNNHPNRFNATQFPSSIVQAPQSRPTECWHFKNRAREKRRRPKISDFQFLPRAKSSVFDLLRRKFGLIQSAKISLRRKKTTIWIIDFIDQNKLWFNGMFTVLPSGFPLLMTHQSIVRFHKIAGSIRLEMPQPVRGEEKIFWKCKRNAFDGHESSAFLPLAAGCVCAATVKERNIIARRYKHSVIVSES